MALALGAFVVGTSELVVVGILNLIAKDTHVSISTAGTLVTAYALGISIGGPLITAATIKFDRRTLLRVTIAIYILGNLAAAFSVGFGMLVVARVITGAVHGLFFGEASVVAASLVPPQHRGSAIGMIFGGIAVSSVAGVPLGTLIGQTLGWQAAFVAIVVLGVVALIAIVIFVPPVQTLSRGDFRTQAKAALAPRVLAMLGVELLLLGAEFTAFTFLAPYLNSVTGISGSVISVFLLAYGLASAVGTFVGGRFADLNPSRTIVVANVALVATFAVLHFVGRTPILVAVVLVVWGLFGFGALPSLQLRVVTLAGSGGDLAATLGASAGNIGIAGGALGGAWVVSRSGVSDVVVAALIIAAIALPCSFAVQYVRAPGEDEPTPSTPRAAADASPASGVANAAG